MREIAIGAGRGHVSSSTVHNIFSKPRVPRWSFLQWIVLALGGDKDERDAFLALWQKAWEAENRGSELPKAAEVPVHRSQADDRRADPAARPGDDAPSERMQAARPAHQFWSREIPSRNHNFTGRVAELTRLSSNLSSQAPSHVQVISGMGGIGKSELAAEYIHRNIDTYEIIWWIRAEHEPRVRDALVQLGKRLGLPSATNGAARDRTVAAVLETLESGAWSSWLLVFDNAVDPLDLEKYIPVAGPGRHVIVTTRQPNRPRSPDTDTIELVPFSDADSVLFLRRAVPILAEEKRLTAAEDAQRDREARRLTTTLGHLPIAVGHAAAYLTDTGQSVGEYLARYTENAHQLLTEQPADWDLPIPVSGTWAVSTALLSPDAQHLFNLCSFLSPEPIATELLQQPVGDLDDPAGLAEFLSSPQRFRTAATQLHRLSLARVDDSQSLIQVHRVVQAVAQGRLRLHSLEAFRAYSAAADALLARSNPGSPDAGSSDHAYNLTLQHLESDDRFLHSESPALRTLIIDQVRRLHLRGGHVEAMRFGQDALEVWRESLGEDDPQVLSLSVEVAIALYVGGRAADAHELIMRIRPLLQEHRDGDGLKALLLCENLYGADLRGRSKFREALELDRSIISKFENVFGKNHERTLNVRNNIAIDYRQLGDFGRALEFDQSTLEDRRRNLGADDIFSLYSANAVARDLRGLGRYQESLDLAHQAKEAFDAAGGRENVRWLQTCQGFATALRKAGRHSEALREGDQVLQRFRDYLGPDHMYTLGAAVELVNGRRAVGDLADAEELARQTLEFCRKPHVPDILRCTALLNLASVLRAGGRPEMALPYDEQAREGLTTIYGERHPFTLAASINYASSLAGCGRSDQAIPLGKDTLDRCRLYLGEDHPDTLMAAANLSRDETADDNRLDGERRLEDALRRYERTLTRDHPEARAAAARTRVTAEIEPYDL